MDPHHLVWDREYFQRGRLWGGAPDELPNLPAGSAVLELGCGDGKTLSAMKTKPWEIYAVDGSAQAISLSVRGPGMRRFVSFVKADVEYLPFADSSFDAVFAYHILGHAPLAGRTNMVIDSVRVLRKGGTLFFRDFEQGDMRSGDGEQIEPYTYLRGNGIITHYFSIDELESLFPGLETLSVSLKSRKMTVRGRPLVRSELVARFRKPW